MAKRGGFPGGMPGNMNNLMKQAQKMQKQMEENQKALEEKEFTATAGGGAVEVTVSGKREIVKVKLSEEAVDPEYDNRYAFDNNRHFIKYVYHIKRDKLFADLFAKLSR